MSARIATLIDKFDNQELIRDQIAAILVIELANQQQLARDASKDSELWRLRVFTERANPWDVSDDAEAADPKKPVPIVNVAWDNSNSDESASNTIERQKVVGTFHLDCYGFGISAESSEGHQPGDERANFEAQRAQRLVRNILMAGTYTYLRMQGVVWQRWVASAQAFQPPLDERPTAHVQGIRISFRVQFNELSPQTEGQPLELLTVEVKRAETGEVLLNANYEYPEP